MSPGKFGNEVEVQKSDAMRKPCLPHHICEIEPLALCHPPRPNKAPRSGEFMSADHYWLLTIMENFQCPLLVCLKDSAKVNGEWRFLQWGIRSFCRSAPLRQLLCLDPLDPLDLVPPPPPFIV